MHTYRVRCQTNPGSQHQTLASCAGIQQSLPNVQNVFMAVIDHFNYTILPEIIGLAVLQHKESTIMPVNKGKNKKMVHKIRKIQEQHPPSNKNNQQKSLKMDTHVFFCYGTFTNSQEKPSVSAGENGLDLSTLDSLESFFILSLILLKNLTASLQVSSRSESRHSK